MAKDSGKSRAGGSLHDCLDLLQSASGGAIDIFRNPLVREIGRYICRVYIHDRYFINFADAAAKINAEASLVFRYGKSIGDEAMVGFGAFLAQKQNIGENMVSGSFGCLGRVLPALFVLDELLKTEPKEPLSLDFWLPELQVMGARSFEGSPRGLYLAAKGGHNDESHNHNDVGNFIVYADGYPAIIDVGVETYTAKTFSSRRYEIWTMQSAYHNLPTINGVMQKNGREYRATDVSYQATKDMAAFSLDISKAYPEQARVKSWKRTITLKRGNQVIINDRYRLDEAIKALQMNLMSWRKPELESEGKIRLTGPEGISGLNPVYIQYDHNKFSVDFEAVPIEDKTLQSSWGNVVYRIVLTARQTPLKDEFSIRIE